MTRERFLRFSERRLTLLSSASFGKQPPDKGPEEEEKTDNGEMYVDAKQRKACGRESGDVEITLTISCPDLRKPERILEALANV